MIRPRLIVRFLAVLLLMICVAMVPSWLMAFLSQSKEHICFLLPVLGVSIISVGTYFGLDSSDRGEISHREAFVIVTSGWLVAAGLAAVPYWLFGWIGGGAKFFFTGTTFFDNVLWHFEGMSGACQGHTIILASFLIIISVLIIMHE